MKVSLAARLRAETTMTVGWIAERLTMGTRVHLNHLLYCRRKLGGEWTISRPDPFTSSPGNSPYRATNPLEVARNLSDPFSIRCGADVSQLTPLNFNIKTRVKTVTNKNTTIIQTRF